VSIYFLAMVGGNAFLAGMFISYGVARDIFTAINRMRMTGWSL